jgi:uridine phosphorylase
VTDAADIPLLEFDPDPMAMIDPAASHPALDGAPEHAVFCFFQDAITELVQRHPGQVVHTFRSENGPCPVYLLDCPAGHVLLSHPGVGAPMSAASMDACIALGARKFIACGGAGVLSRRAIGHVIVPSRALRDEGTSYHYQPASRWIEPDPRAKAALLDVLSEKQLPHEAGAIWTTDAYFRETRNKVARRKAENCLAVDMECAAFCAVARFRGVQFAQALYAGDSLAEEQWDARGWTRRTEIRGNLLELAIEACLRL